MKRKREILIFAPCHVLGKWEVVAEAAFGEVSVYWEEDSPGLVRPPVDAQPNVLEAGEWPHDLKVSLLKKESEYWTAGELAIIERLAPHACLYLVSSRDHRRLYAFLIRIQADTQLFQEDGELVPPDVFLRNF